jgi:hypothetical protein
MSMLIDRPRCCVFESRDLGFYVCRSNKAFVYGNDFVTSFRQVIDERNWNEYLESGGVRLYKYNDV